MADEQTVATEPTPQEVMTALADQVGALTFYPERIIVQSVNPFEYVARVYAPNNDDYEGFRVVLS